MGALYIVSTPIGNLGDLSPRAQKILSFVDLVLCEDTRRTARLTERRLMRFDEHTQDTLIPEILTHQNVALVSDAGTPLISDPGFTLVRECIKRGIKVVSIPGPSTVLAALTSSGLPANKFMFLGYPPEKQSHPSNSSDHFRKTLQLFFIVPPTNWPKHLRTLNNLLEISTSSSLAN